MDTDWVVRLTVATPTGESLNLAEGMLCARYRNSYSQPGWLIPEEVYEYEILTSKISYCLKQGDKLRLDITSSAKNYSFPHSNTKDGANSLIREIAHQKIYSGKEYPSKVMFKVE